MDYNVWNYSKKELLNIFGIENDGDDDIIYSASKELIHKYASRSSADPQMLTFLKEARDVLLYDDEDDVEGFANMDAEEKSTSTKEKSTNEEVVPLQPSQQQVSGKTQNVFTAPYQPGKLNPILNPTTTRILTIDSKYREDKVNAATDFTFSLSTPIRDVLSLKMYSVAIPYAWYTVDTAYGSNFIYLRGKTPGIDTGDHDYKIEILPGNYTAAELVAAINTSLKSFFSVYDPSNSSVLTYTTNNLVSTFSFDFINQYNESDYDVLFDASAASFLNFSADPFETDIVKSTGVFVSEKKITPGSLFTPFGSSVATLGTFYVDTYFEGSTVADLISTITVSSTVKNLDQLLIEINAAIQNTYSVSSWIDPSNSYVSYVDNVQNTTTNIIMKLKMARIGTQTNYRSKLRFPTVEPGSIGYILGFNYEVYNFEDIYSGEIISTTYPIDSTTNFQFNCADPSFNVSANVFGPIYLKDSSGYDVSGNFNIPTIIQYMNNGITSLNNSAISIMPETSNYVTVDPSGKANINTNITKLISEHSFKLWVNPMYAGYIGIGPSYYDSSGVLVDDLSVNSLWTYKQPPIDRYPFNNVEILKLIPTTSEVSGLGEIVFTVNGNFDSAELIAELNYQFSNRTHSYGNVTTQLITNSSNISFNVLGADYSVTLDITVKFTLTEMFYKMALSSGLSSILKIDNNTLFVEDTPIESTVPIYSGTQSIDESTNIITIRGVSSGVSSGNDITLNVPGANYSVETLVNALQTAIDAESVLDGTTIQIVQDGQNSYILLKLVVNRIYTAADYELIFYDKTLFTPTVTTSVQVNPVAKKDNTLGWILGYRENSYDLAVNNPIVGTAAINVNGPSYLYIILDDFNQNHMNKSVITVAGTEKSIPVPSASYGDFVIDISGGLQIAVAGNSASSAKRLTQKQLYSINSILYDKQTQLESDFSSSGAIKDVMAMIPIKPGAHDSVYVEFGGTLQNQNRMYFGPVNIQRMNVKLVNDKGDVVNLNGTDWSFSVICESLYQYS